MTIIANTFLTYAQIGQREDLSDVIDMISPTDTPVQSALRKSKASGRYVEWQTDALASAANNAQLEGDDSTFTAVTPTVRWGNYCQIGSKSFLISETAETVDKAGRNSEVAYQTMNKLKELKRDKEFALMQNSTFNAGNATTARQTRGFKGWITQGSVGAGAGAFPIPSSNTAPVAGTARALTEPLVLAAMQTAFTAGGAPSLLSVRPADKVVVSGFSANNTVLRREDSDSNKLHQSFDFYVTDFGTLKVVPNRFQDNAAYLIDTNHASLRQLRPASRQALAKTGDAQKVLVVEEWAFQCDSKDAHAVIRDLS